MRLSCGIPVAIVVAWLSAVTIVTADLRPHWVRKREECAARKTGGGKVFSWQTNVLSKDNRYKDINHFQGLFVDEEKRLVVVGAKDVILHLDAILLSVKTMVNKTVKPKEKVACIELARAWACHNFNMLLLPVVKNGQRSYLECGTGAYNPSCSWRSVETGHQQSVPDGEAYKMCPFEPTDKGVTASFLDDAVYSATTTSFNEVLVGRFFRIPNQVARRDDSWLNGPDFIDSFTRGDHVYFFLRETANEVEPLNVVYSRVLRLCKRDSGETFFHSFMKLRIACTLGQKNKFRFNWITSVFRHNGPYKSVRMEDLLYATFHLPPNGPAGSAVCLYRMRDLTEAFDTFLFTYQSGDSWKTQPRVKNSSCLKTKKDTIEESSKYINLQGKIDGLPILLMEGIRVTNILVDRVGSFDVMFLGTDEGELLKVTRQPNGGLKPLVIDRYKVSDSPFRKMVHFPKLGQVVINTKNDVYSVNYLHCMRSAQSCRACVVARDPYCGWCPQIGDVDNLRPRCLPQSLCSSTTPNLNLRYLQDVHNGDESICGEEVEIEHLFKHPIMIAKEGNGVVFQFKVKNANELRWQRGDSDERFRMPMSFGSRIRKSYNKDNNIAKLTIQNVFIRDMDKYHLIASNNISSKNATIQLLVTGKPRVVRHPVSQTVPLNGSAIFECGWQSRGRSFSQIVSWQFKAEEDKPWTKVSPSSSQNEVLQTVKDSLVILHVQKRYEGFYQCLVRNDDSRVTSNIAQLRIASTTMVIRHPANQTVRFNRSATFECGFQGEFSKISWQFKAGEGKPWNKVLTNTAQNEMRQTAEHSLIIDRVQEKHEGFYQCIVTSDDRRVTSYVAQLRIASTPRVVHHPANQTLRFNESAVFECGLQSHGHSFPQIILWRFKAEKGKPWTAVSTHTGRNRVLQTVEHSLIILSVQKENEGFYQCLVQSGDSHVTSYVAELRIVSAPVQSHEIQRDIIGMRNDNLMIHCGLTGDITEYSWLKDGALIDFAPRTERSPGQPCRYQRTLLQNGSLSIACAQPADCGIYQCEAKNSLYTLRGQPVEACVRETSRDMSLVSSGQHLVGGNIILRCTFTGRFASSFRWTGPDGLRIIHDKKYIFSTFKYHSRGGFTQISQHITIINAQIGDAGTYGCQAMFRGSTVNRTEYTLRFTSAYEHFTESPAHILIPAATDMEEPLRVRFFCHARCTSTQNYTFTWWHNRHAITTNDYSEVVSGGCHSHLSLVTRNSARDEGLYECRATLQSHDGNTCTRPAASAFGYLTAGDLSNDEMNVSMEVHVPSCQRATIVCPEYIARTEAGSGTMPWQMQVSWKAVGQSGEINIGTDTSESIHVTSHGHLRFKSLQPSMAGYYSCSIMDNIYIIRVKLKDSL